MSVARAVSLLPACLGPGPPEQQKFTFLAISRSKNFFNCNRNRKCSQTRKRKWLPGQQKKTSQMEVARWKLSPRAKNVAYLAALLKMLQTLSPCLALAPMATTTSSLFPYCLTHLRSRRLSHDIVKYNFIFFFFFGGGGGRGDLWKRTHFLIDHPVFKNRLPLLSQMNCMWSSYRDKSFHRE